MSGAVEVTVIVAGIAAFLAALVFTGARQGWLEGALSASVKITPPAKRRPAEAMPAAEAAEGDVAQLPDRGAA